MQFNLLKFNLLKCSSLYLKDLQTRIGLALKSEVYFILPNEKKWPKALGVQISAAAVSGGCKGSGKGSLFSGFVDNWKQEDTKKQEVL